MCFLKVKPGPKFEIVHGPRQTLRLKMHNLTIYVRRIDPYLSPCPKLKSIWIKDLNIKPTTLNLIEEKVGSTLEAQETTSLI